MKSTRKMIYLPLILSLFLSMTALSQDTLKYLTRKNIDLSNQSYRDAFTYRNMYDSVSVGLDSADRAISNLEMVVIQAGKTIQAKDETAAFYKSQAEMWSKENGKLERRNLFWRLWAGVTTAVSGVLIIRGL
jgi:hypothetical protein